MQAVRKERERYRERWPIYRKHRQQKRDAERLRGQQERLRDQLIASVEAAAKQARDRELATRKVNW